MFGRLYCRITLWPWCESAFMCVIASCLSHMSRVAQLLCVAMVSFATPISQPSPLLLPRGPYFTPVAPTLPRRHYTTPSPLHYPVAPTSPPWPLHYPVAPTLPRRPYTTPFRSSPFRSGVEACPLVVADARWGKAMPSASVITLCEGGKQKMGARVRVLVHRTRDPPQARPARPIDARPARPLDAQPARP